MLLLGVGSGFGRDPALAFGAHRYWRVNITDNNHATNNTTGLIELQMHAGTNGFGVDQCEGGTGSADTEFAGGFVATNAFDNDLQETSSGVWASTDTAFPHWIKYDFGSDKTIYGISILGRGNNGISVSYQSPVDFTVQFSSDNSTWTTAWSETGITWSEFQEKHFKHGTASSYSGSPHGSHAYWRVHVIRNDGGGNVSTAEVEFRATPSGADQATGGTPSANSFFNASFVASNAFDNNNATAWANGSGSGNSWIQYQFAAPVLVAEVTIRSRSDSNANQSPKDFVVQYSDDGSVWTIAWGVVSSTGWSLSETRTFTDPYYV